MKVWVTRERKGHDLSYFVFIWSARPVWSGVEWMSLENCSVMNVRAKEAREVLGFTPRKGSCKLYKLTLKEIK